MPNNTKANRRYGRPPYAAVCVLESGGNRVNMLTQRFAFVPPCGAFAPFNLERVNNCFFGKQPTVAGLERIGGLIMEKRSSIMNAWRMSEWNLKKNCNY